jgi:spore germination protein YaaH
LNLSVVTTVVDGSKLGGQLEVAVDGKVSWRAAVGNPGLVCAAHARNVRVLPIVGHPKVPHQEHAAFDYHGLLSNATAVARAARELSMLVAAAGYDGVEFDMEALGAPYGKPHVPGGFDYGMAYVGLVAATRAALRAATTAHATTFVTVGALNVSAQDEAPVFAAYPLVPLAEATDGIFIMGYDMNKGHDTCAGPNAPIDVLGAYVGGYIAVGVPPEKLILGIPWYGRQYYCNGTGTGLSVIPACTRSTCFCGSPGHYAPYEGVPSLWQTRARLRSARTTGCSRGWDERAGSPWMDCPATATVPRTQTWYDDENSTRLKVELADRLGLGGIGVFSAEMAGDPTTVGDEEAVKAAWAALSRFNGRLVAPAPATDRVYSGVNTPALGGVFNVRDFGAVGNNVTYDTAAVRAAALALREAGGGTLLFPRDKTYLTGCINLSSHTTVVIEPGATVVGSPQVDDWPLIDPLPYMGWGSMNQGLLYCTGCVNVTLTGGGTIDGLDQPWYPMAPAQCSSAPPCAGTHLVLFRNSTGVVVSNVTVIRSRNWALHFAWVTDLHVERVTVDIDGGDAIDLTCVHNAVIEQSVLAAGKDAIGVKSGAGHAGRLFGRPTRNVVFRDIHVGRGHGLSIGDEIAAGVINVTFERIFLNGTRAGPRIKSKPGTGGFIDNITYRNITGVRMGVPPGGSDNPHHGSLNEAWRDIDIDLDWTSNNSTKTGNTSCTNLLFDGVQISGGVNAGVFIGTGTTAIVNVTLRNVKLGGGAISNAAFQNCTHVKNGVCIGDTVDPCPPCFTRQWENAMLFK